LPENTEVLRSKFISIYSDLPSKLREEIIAIVNEKPYTWNSAFFEVKSKSKEGDEILKRLEKIGVLQD